MIFEGYVKNEETESKNGNRKSNLIGNISVLLIKIGKILMTSSTYLTLEKSFIFVSKRIFEIFLSR